MTFLHLTLDSQGNISVAQLGMGPCPCRGHYHQLLRVWALFHVIFFCVTCVCFLMPWALQSKDCHFVWYAPLTSRLWWDTGGITWGLDGGRWMLLQHCNLLSDWACVFINQQVLLRERCGCYSHSQQLSCFPLFSKYWDKTKPGLSYLPVCRNLGLLLNLKLEQMLYYGIAKLFTVSKC